MTPQSEKALSGIGRKLRTFGMPASDVSSLVADLRADIAAAETEGAGTEAVIGDDVALFTRRLALAHGYQPVPQRMLGLSLAAFLPMSVIAFIVYVVIAGGGENLGLPHLTVSIRGAENRPVLQNVNEGWFILATYLSAAALGVGLTLGGAAAYLRLRNDTCIARTIRNMAIALPLGGVLGVAAAMAFGAARNYPTTPAAILFECFLVACGVLGSLWVARRMARMLPHRAPTAGSPGFDPSN